MMCAVLFLSHWFSESGRKWLIEILESFELFADQGSSLRHHISGTHASSRHDLNSNRASGLPCFISNYARKT